MFSNPDLLHFIFGRLSLDSLPFHEPILVVTFAAVVLGGIAVLGGITYFRLWGYLWNEWITSIDHKKIGIMYIILALVMLLRGFSDALMMRAQQAMAFGGSEGFLPPDHYDQIFTAHGVIMIFFVAMPLVTGIMNYVVPLQIGARDVSFPFLNNFSFWMTTAGAVIVMASLFVGEFARTGWLAYPPLSGIGYSPGVGVDYYIWALQIAGVGTTLSGINLIATIVKMRAPGMGMMKMPVFTWTSLCTNVLIVASFPVLTAVLALLTLDRYVGTNFFTNDFGGNPMMYVNLIWIWGHPEVYILILPLFGVFSEIASTFSGKKLFGYTSMVYATVVITILSYLVWLHHFFTMGSGASVNSFFGITTMIISIPTGAKIFNWLFTMYRGRIRFELPMMWLVAFMLTFPDVNAVLRKIKGRLFPFGWFHLLRWLRRPRNAAMRVPLMGVRRELHNSRLASQLAFMMIGQIRDVATVRYGTRRAEIGWILDDNQGMKAIADAIGSEINREYAIYERSLVD